MGMKRGAFESTQLGQVATSAKNSEIPLESVARGMTAFGDGLGAVSDLCGKLADMADKAYKVKNANFKSAGDSLKALTNAEADLSLVKDAYKGREGTPEAKLAISRAESAVNKAQENSYLAIDKYSRSGLFYYQNGKASVQSGREKYEAAERADAKNKKGILRNVEKTGFFDAFTTEIKQIRNGEETL